MRIHRLVLQAESPSTCGEFYGEVLGLDVHFAGGIATVRAGGTSIGFHPCEPGVHPKYHVAFNVPPNRFMQSLRWLRARVPLLNQDGIEVFEFPDWHAHALYFLDPAGNILEFIARHERPSDNSSENFAPEHILNVSEIGVPVPDVVAAAGALRTEFGLPAYRPGGAEFATIGDAEGLLILVRTGRVWHPDTGIEATDLPAEVEVDGPFEKSGLIPGSRCKITTHPRS